MLAVLALNQREVAARGPGADGLQGDQSQPEMNDSSGRRASAAKKRLAKLIAELGGTLDPESSKKLADLQRRWAELRELDCRWEESGFEGGSAAPMVYANCVADRTEERIRRLKVFLCEGASMTAPCDASRKY